jgi:hypothetical protein
MTAIVAVETRGGAWIGCDSFCGDDRFRDLYDRPKWSVHANGTIVIATSGNVRPGQIAESTKVGGARRSRETDVAYVIRTIVEPVRKAHIDAGVIANDGRGDEGHMPHMNAVIVALGKVWMMDEEYGVWRSLRRVAAAGAGAEHAQLSLASNTKMNAKARVEAALHAAADHNNLVCGPFYTLWVPTKK